MLINEITESKSLLKLLDLIRGFCRESALGDNTEKCIRLKEAVENAEGNDYLTLLSSYLSICETGDEVIEALEEFADNCKGFAEANEDMTEQITKAEFETVLCECEEKCGLMSCVEAEHTVNIAEADAESYNREGEIQFIGSNINILLPRIDINTDKTKYIAENIGHMLYDVIVQKLEPDDIRYEINRYIPEVKNRGEPVRELFRECFYSVILYKTQKPKIYQDFNEHMYRVVVLEFFKRIIVRYLRE
ncbi:hypothetical protein FMM68_02800 [Lachnospiraceae bacterium MD329]|nr:hypothetical protein [Lachnospiraceae bacterium MD329]